MSIKSRKNKLCIYTLYIFAGLDIAIWYSPAIRWSAIQLYLCPLLLERCTTQLYSYYTIIHLGIHAATITFPDKTTNGVTKFPQL